MGVIDGARLRRFMSEPKWTASQDETAELVCEAVEAQLEAALFGTFITPRPWAETAPVLADRGLMDTAYPVYRATRLDDGPTLSEDDPLPEPYLLQGHRLYRTPDDDPPTAALLSGWPFAAALAGPSRPAGQRYSGRVRVEYLAGWGGDPALVLAMLRKAQTLMGNRHDDTVTVRGLTATPPPKLAPEDWTEAELKPLGKYRRLGVGGRR